MTPPGKADKTSASRVSSRVLLKRALVATLIALFAALAFGSGASAAEPVPALLGAVAATTQQALAPVAQVADAATSPATLAPAAAPAATVASSSVERVTATVSDAASARPPTDASVAAQALSATVSAPKPAHALHEVVRQTARHVGAVVAGAPAEIIATAATATATSIAAPGRAERLVERRANAGATRLVARVTEELPVASVRPTKVVAGPRKLFDTLEPAVFPTALPPAQDEAASMLGGSLEGSSPLVPPSGIATQPLFSARTRSTSPAVTATASMLTAESAARDETGDTRATGSALVHSSSAMTRRLLAARAAAPQPAGGGTGSPTTSGAGAGFGFALALVLSALLLCAAPSLLRRLQPSAEAARIAPFQLIPTRPG
jgi:hypothetical protein